MRKLDFLPNFKKDLSNIELLGIEKALENASLDVENVEFLPMVVESAKDYFGLSFTSSSSYAMYGVDTLIFIEDGIQISHFSMTENNMLIIVAHDNDENYFYYELENTDF